MKRTTTGTSGARGAKTPAAIIARGSANIPNDGRRSRLWSRIKKGVDALVTFEARQASKRPRTASRQGRSAGVYVATNRQPSKTLHMTPSEGRVYKLVRVSKGGQSMNFLANKLQIAPGTVAWNLHMLTKKQLVKHATLAEVEAPTKRTAKPAKRHAAPRKHIKRSAKPATTAVKRSHKKKPVVAEPVAAAETSAQV